MIIMISPRRTWAALPRQGGPYSFADAIGAQVLRSITLTPRSRLWVDPDTPASPGQRNPLAAALADLLGHPVGPVHGPACLIGDCAGHPVDLDQRQIAGFDGMLRFVCQSPDLIAQHQRAARVLAQWTSDPQQEAAPR